MTDLHLSQMDFARISQCQSRYNQHPQKLVQIANFLPLSLAHKVSRLLKSHAEFGSVYGLHKAPGHIVEKQTWIKSPENNRFFHYEMLKGLNSHGQGMDALAFLKLRQFLSSNPFCEFVRQVTGDDIVSATNARVHRIRKGHYLRPHDDRSGTRRIAYILYLSPDWRPQFGGRLSLIGHDNLQEKVSPEYNSLVLFDVEQNQQHSVEALNDVSKGWSRDTMSGWLLGKKRPEAV